MPVRPTHRPIGDRVAAPHRAPRARPARRSASRDRGSVTAETAMALPSLVVLLLIAVWVLLCVAAQLRCVDAAYVAARAAARGDGDAAVVTAALRVAPQGAQVQVSRQDGEVAVSVHAAVQPFAAVLGALPAVDVSARAVAADEEAVAGAFPTTGAPADGR